MVIKTTPSALSMMVMGAAWLVLLWGSQTEATITRSGTVRGNDYERHLSEEVTYNEYYTNKSKKEKKETTYYEYYGSKGSKGGYDDSKKAKSCKSDKTAKKGYYGYYDQ
jgi:hypothetical protein